MRVIAGFRVAVAPLEVMAWVDAAAVRRTASDRATWAVEIGPTPVRLATVAAAHGQAAVATQAWAALEAGACHAAVECREAAGFEAAEDDVVSREV